MCPPTHSIHPCKINIVYFSRYSRSWHFSLSQTSVNLRALTTCHHLPKTQWKGCRLHNFTNNHRSLKEYVKNTSRFTRKPQRKAKEEYLLLSKKPTWRINVACRGVGAWSATEAALSDGPPPPPSPSQTNRSKASLAKFLTIQWLAEECQLIDRLNMSGSRSGLQPRVKDIQKGTCIVMPTTWTLPFKMPFQKLTCAEM